MTVRNEKDGSNEMAVLPRALGMLQACFRNDVQAVLFITATSSISQQATMFERIDQRAPSIERKTLSFRTRGPKGRVGSLTHRNAETAPPWQPVLDPQGEERKI